MLVPCSWVVTNSLYQSEEGCVQTGNEWGTGAQGGRLLQGFRHVCVKGKCLPHRRANIYYCRNASESYVERTDLKFDNPAPSVRVWSFWIETVLELLGSCYPGLESGGRGCTRRLAALCCQLFPISCADCGKKSGELWDARAKRNGFSLSVGAIRWDFERAKAFLRSCWQLEESKLHAINKEINRWIKGQNRMSERWLVSSPSTPGIQRLH